MLGAIDGLLTTFAIISGVAGAKLHNEVAIILGCANLLADGFSMAISNYSRARSDKDFRPWKSAMTTFSSFCLIGFIPLFPFFVALIIPFSHIYFWSSSLTFIAFYILGFFQGFYTQRNAFFAGFETLFLGVSAAGIAYGISFLIKKISG